MNRTKQETIEQTEQLLTQSDNIANNISLGNNAEYPMNTHTKIPSNGSSKLMRLLKSRHHSIREGHRDAQRSQKKR